MGRLKAKLSRLPMEYLESKGYLIVRADDYYSPLVSASRLRSSFERWNRPTALLGIDYDVERMKSDLSGLLSHYLDEFSTIPPYATLQKVGFGPGYTAVDALTLYMMVRNFKPRRYIEVGSGLSTYYCSLQPPGMPAKAIHQSSGPVQPASARHA